MKKLIFFVLVASCCLHLSSQKILIGNEAASKVPGSSILRYDDGRNSPDFIALKKSAHLAFDNGMGWVEQVLGLRPHESLEISRVEKDQLGMEHYIYQHYYAGIPVEYSEYRMHVLNNEVLSFNGQFHSNIQVNTLPVITSDQAIALAGDFIGADIYKWEIPGEEKFIKWRKKDPNATYQPQPELVIASKNGDYKNPDFRLCWKMNIYAHQPMSRHWVYVDAETGEIVLTENQICHVDVPGTAQTAYSGSRSIIADSFGGPFRLREAGRGNGVETYDMNEDTNYGNAVDFTDTDNNWINPIPANDQYALDAHWGAEMTYDYFMNLHGRNSIDGSGFALLSFIHYDINYANAFWNGSEMTYGDGSGIITPLTTVDITGHEITHGLTGFTAGLIYQDESGALNESFSDIFGATIDNYARGTTGDTLWRIGEECFLPNGIRLMNNPSAFGDPDTYEGTGWISPGGPDNGGVHTNSGVQNYWYYLMCEGGTGVNDNVDAYNVTGIGLVDAGKIAFRNLTVYLSPGSDFNDARFYAIVSAQDLFGDCSPEVETTTNAWYAVGVGDPYSAGVTADFIPSAYNICTVPTSVSFDNNTLTGNAATTYSWDFGDGSFSTQANPSHVYTANGTYNVSLIANAGGCGIDSVLYTALINISLPTSPVASNYCTNVNPVIADLNATSSGTVYWYSSPSSSTPLFIGNNFTTPSLSANTTYYIETQIPNGSQHADPLNNSFGTGNYFDSPYSEYLTFTVLQPIVLNSVRVYSGSSGNRTIELWSGTGTPINSLVANIPSGESVVTLDWALNPGNYRIGGTHMDLYKNGTGCTYPYILPSLLSITGSSDGPNRYFYFYDWVVSSSCISPRVPVIVNLNAPTASFTWNITGTVVNFTNTSTNGVSYFWDFGGGNTSTQQNPTHDYVWGGPHTATLTVENNGCFSTYYVDLDIIGIEENSTLSGSIYPIPFNSYITIDLALSGIGENIDIVAYNMLGEKVQDIYKGTVTHSNFTYTWNTPANMASGVYLIKVIYNGKELAKRVVKL